MAQRISDGIPIHTRSIDEAERVGLGVAAQRRIVMPVSVIVQPRFDLEPLAREARVERRRTRDRLRRAPSRRRRAKSNS